MEIFDAGGFPRDVARASSCTYYVIYKSIPLEARIDGARIGLGPDSRSVHASQNVVSRFHGTDVNYTTVDGNFDEDFRTFGMTS